MINIAVMGFGVVGSGVAEVVEKNRATIARKLGDTLQVKYILDVRDFPGHPLESKFVKDVNVILNDPDISVVVETIGGLHPAYDFSSAALAAGKSVVSSNKEVVATRGAELLELARRSNVSYLFEASVGGGIPIIRPMHQCLAANEIDEVVGILNGTTNFILTKMVRSGATFDGALSEAQSLGYAERNPAADVEGVDACRKICILASLAFGKHVFPDRVHTEGITEIDLQDVAYAAEAGGVIKLLGRARRLPEGRVFAMVSPCLIGRSHPLANVEDVYNGIVVRGNAIGDVMFYGKGAGKLPTASAIVADVIDAVKNQGSRMGIYWKETEEPFVVDYREEPTSFYIRYAADDQTAARRAAEELFGPVAHLTPRGPVGAFLTASAPEGEHLGRLERFSAFARVLSRIRVPDGEFERS